MHQFRALRHIHVVQFFVHRHVEVEQFWLIAQVYACQLVEVEVEIFQRVVLTEVYGRYLVVCSIVGVTLAVEVSHVTIYFHLCSFCGAVNPCPCIAVDGVWLQFSVTPVDVHCGVVAVSTKSVCAHLACWHRKRDALLAAYIAEHRLHVGVCRNHEQCVLNECAIHHDSFIFLTFLCFVTHTKNRAWHHLAIAAHLVVITREGIAVCAPCHVALHHLVCAASGGLLREHNVAHRARAVALNINYPVCVGTILHEILLGIGSFAVTTLNVYTACAVRVADGLIHEVERLGSEVLVSLQIEIAQHEIVGCKVEELKVAILCRQCLQPFQSAHFQAVNVQRVAVKTSQRRHLRHVEFSQFGIAYIQACQFCVIAEIQFLYFVVVHCQSCQLRVGCDIQFCQFVATHAEVFECCQSSHVEF